MHFTIAGTIVNTPSVTTTKGGKTLVRIDVEDENTRKGSSVFALTYWNPSEDKLRYLVPGALILCIGTLTRNPYKNKTGEDRLGYNFNISHLGLQGISDIPEESDDIAPF